MDESTRDAVEYTSAQVFAGVLEIFPGGSLLSKALLVPLELAERSRTERIIGRLLADVEELKLNRKIGWTVEDLATSERFMANLTEMMRASKATSDEEKRKLLRNAVINSELDPQELGKDEFFLRMMGRYSVRHIRFLRFVEPMPPFVSPEMSYPTRDGKTTGVMRDIPALAREAFPESAELVSPIFQDLRSDGLLVRTQPLTYGLNDTGDGTRPDTISSLGKEFLRFVADPLQT